jgi:hypothetical protein
MVRYRSALLHQIPDHDHDHDHDIVAFAFLAPAPANALRYNNQVTADITMQGLKVLMLIFYIAAHYLRTPTFWC